MRMLRCKPRPKECWKVHSRYKSSNSMKNKSKEIKSEYPAIFWTRDSTMDKFKYTLYIKIR